MYEAGQDLNDRVVGQDSLKTSSNARSRQGPQSRCDQDNATQNIVNWNDIDRVPS